MSETPNFQSGYIAVMGRPNVGKSTLLNHLLGQKIAAVSPKPQTTRLQQLGILTTPQAQLIFMDTPGLHIPQHKLGHFMNQAAREALEDADLGLLVVDGTITPPLEEDRLLVQLLGELASPPPILIVVNKIDLLTPAQVQDSCQRYQALLPGAELTAVSASTGAGIDALLEKLTGMLPEGPRYFPEEQITDLFERDIAADLIRAAAMNHLKYELPHSVAVRMDEYKERNQHGAYIAATLFVERESQKPILIGEGGKKIKQISMEARREIEEMSGRKVYLDLRVKVRKNWRNDDQTLRLFGFK